MPLKLLQPLALNAKANGCSCDDLCKRVTVVKLPRLLLTADTYRRISIDRQSAYFLSIESRLRMFFVLFYIYLIIMCLKINSLYSDQMRYVFLSTYQDNETIKLSAKALS